MDLTKQDEIEEDEELDLETESECDSDADNNSIRTVFSYDDKKEIPPRRRWFSSTSMWYLTIESLGTALRILAPAAILSWFYKHDSFLSRILQHCDKAVRSILFSTPEQTDGVLKWLQELFPNDQRVQSLDAVWGDGSIICDIVETVVPGSCHGHKAEKRTDLCHGQRLAEQYLGVTPIFSKEDLTQAVLSTYQECRLTHYLSSLREALNRISPPLSRAGSPILNVQAYTLDYVARGMGLVTAFQNKKASFYIYPTAQQALEPGDISILIKSPDGGYGSALVPAIYGRAHIIRNVLLNLGHRQNSMVVHLPITCGSTSYIRTPSYKSNVYMPKVENDIEVNIVVKNDRVKITYIPTEIGSHELSLITKGCHIIGSPFVINVESETLDRKAPRDYDDEDFSLQDSNKNDRKVVFRIVDFVTEKMLLNEDGKLEKISNEDAAALLHKVESMENMTLKCLHYNQSLPGPDLIEYNKTIENNTEKSKGKGNFNNIAKKIMLMLKICRELKHLARVVKNNREKYNGSSESTPDIVNSTLKEHCPEDVSNVTPSAEELRQQFKNKISSFNRTNEKEDFPSNTVDDINSSQENLLAQENNRRVVVYKSPSIEIVISSFDDDDVEIDKPQTDITLEAIPERPKTPVFKLLAEDEIDNLNSPLYHGFDKDNSQGRFDSLDYFPAEYNKNPDVNTLLDLSSDIIEDGKTSPVINFHIGEPVTPTHLMSMPNLDMDMDSIIEAPNLEEALQKYDVKIQNCLKNLEQHPSDDTNSSIFETLPRQSPFQQMTDSEIIKMYEQPLSGEDSHHEATDELNDSPQNFDTQERDVKINVLLPESSTDTLDSAYISIDEINSSPDTVSSKADFTKEKLFSIEESDHEYSQLNEDIPSAVDEDTYFKMGPAERELWLIIQDETKENSTPSNDNEKEQIPKTHSNFATSRNIISPIDENEIYPDDAINTENKMQTLEERDDSASDFTADVERSTEKNLESKIMTSSIQTSDSEFEYASQQIKNEKDADKKDGDEKRSRRTSQNKKHTRKSLSKMVSEKKEYWDDKIKLIENDEEKRTKTLKKRSSTQRKPDYLNKMKASDIKKDIIEEENEKQGFQADASSDSSTDQKSVAIWKKYWDEKIENSPSPDSDSKYIQKEISKTRKYLTSPDEFLNQNRAESSLAFLDDIPTRSSSGASTCSEQRIDTPTVVEDARYQAEAINLLKLSHRIDKFLDTVSSSSPNIDLEQSRFSTPDVFHGNPITNHIDLFNQKMSNDNTIDNKLLKIEKDNEKILVTWNNDSNEKRLKSLENLSNRSTPMPKNNYPENVETSTIDLDENSNLPKDISIRPFSSLSQIENFDDDTLDNELERELQSLPYIANVKAKIETFNSNSVSDIRKSFIENKSKTIDFPKAESFNHLRKYFSADCMEDNSKSEFSFEKDKVIYKPKNNNLTMTKNDMFVVGDNDKNSEANLDSIESMPSLAEKKARIESHLKSIQNKLKNQPANLTEKHQNFNEQSACKPYGVERENVVNGSFENNILEIQKEIEQISKPISAIVAMFQNQSIKNEHTFNKKGENHSKNHRNYTSNENLSMPYTKLDADSLEGTKEKHNENSFLSVDSNNIDMKNDLIVKFEYDTNKECVTEEKTNTKYEENIQSEKYKERFKKARMFFEQLNEFQKRKSNPQSRPLNECEKLLHDIVSNNFTDEKNLFDNKSDENNIDDIKTALNNEVIYNTLNDKFQKIFNNHKKIDYKAFSAPTSDTETEYQNYLIKRHEGGMLLKITEKYLVEDLYRDIAGESNRTGFGTFKGIPHKNAVLAAFKSVENINQITSYDYTKSQMQDFAKSNSIINSQTYHNRFQNLPITEPNKYRSGYDINSSGLFLEKDFIKLQRARRNSAPCNFDLYTSI